MNHNYKIVDAHCDTIGEIYKKTSLKKSKGHLDIERMKRYENYMQIFAVWTDASQGLKEQKRRQNEIINRFYDEISSNSEDIIHIKNAEEIRCAWADNKIAALLGIEGADCVLDIGDIDDLYKKGVRIVTLTWNGSNAIASGVGDENAAFGLTDFGKSVVARMNTLGMVIDVSHISKRAFWEVLEATSSPIMASHSNSKAVCAHRRNLTDEQFNALCKNGGVAGINYYPQFVNYKEKASIDDIILHIEHFCALGGEDNIGLGGDFDGIDTTPCDLCGVEDVYRLLDRLLALNYSEECVKKLAYENFIRFFEAVL